MTNNNALSNPPPKTRFLQSADNITKHRSMVDSREYERAVDFGLMQYFAELAAQVKDGNSAAMVGFKVAGAFEAVQSMRMLSEQPKVTRVPVNDNLTEQ
jgi:hypothetical protein